MGVVQRLTSTDVDDVETSWRQFVPTARLNALDPADFRFDWRAATSGGFSSIDFDLVASVRSAINPHDQLFVGQATGPRTRVTSERGSIDSTGPWVSPGEHTTTEWETRAHVRAFVFDLPQAQRAARIMSGDSHLVLRPVGAEPISVAAGRQWTAAFDYVHAGRLDAVENAQHLLDAELRRHALRTTLTVMPTTFLDALERRIPANPAEATVRRAKAYMDERAHESITVEDVAAAVHTSTRALQYAFKRATGESPMLYLRRARLAGADADLRSGGELSVADVARRWGFGHPSRFAEYYRRSYGRNPSQILREK
jgi:AraC-like DNA-binding protein